MKTECAANESMQALAAERARWAAVLAPGKPRNHGEAYAQHMKRGARQGFRPLGWLSFLAMSMLASAGPR